MYDSLQAYGLKPARHLYPWDSPGKNTGVAMPSSRVSSWPRDWTRVSCRSCIAGGFFIADPQGSLMGESAESYCGSSCSSSSLCSVLSSHQWYWTILETLCQSTSSRFSNRPFSSPCLETSFPTLCLGNYCYPIDTWDVTCPERSSLTSL